MASMTDLMDELLQGGALDQISSRIGADPAQTRQAIQQALPMLLGGLERNAASPQGAQSLQHALATDNHASILDDLSGYLSGTRQDRASNGAGILEHILGAQQQPAAQALSAKSGLGSASIMQLLITLAPLVMGMLGKKAGSGGMPDLGSILGQERSTAQDRAPDMGDILGQVFGGGSAIGAGTGAASSPVPSGSTSTNRSSGGLLGSILDMLRGRR
jgi:hypothetical protein